MRLVLAVLLVAALPHAPVTRAADDRYALRESRAVVREAGTNSPYSVEHASATREPERDHGYTLVAAKLTTAAAADCGGAVGDALFLDGFEAPPMM